MKINSEEALKQLAKSNAVFKNVFEHGTLSVEVYKPENKDLQKPHERDEVYVIISGRGEFYNQGTKNTFEAGDLFFVKAGNEHRFENFTDDFSTWVLFYGPKGGENSNLL